MVKSVFMKSLDAFFMNDVRFRIAEIEDAQWLQDLKNTPAEATVEKKDIVEGANSAASGDRLGATPKGSAPSPP